MSTEADYDALLQQVDQKFTQYMELVEHLLQLRESLSQTMKNGFFNISKAKYSMGQTTISAVKYPQRMCAHSFVKTNHGTSSTPSNFVLSLATYTETSADDSPKTKVRQRRHNSADKDFGTKVLRHDNGAIEFDDSDDDSIEDGPNNIKNSLQRDPLRWFGVLVSPNLRQSQKDFQQALRVVVEIANITQQMDSIQQEYFTLLKTKKEKERERRDKG